MKPWTIASAPCWLALLAGTAASQSYRISDPLARATPAGVDGFLVPGDETRILFLGDYTPTGSGNQLFVVPADGSTAPVLLATAPGGTITGYTIAAQSGRAVFTRDGINLRRIFSVPLDASAPEVLLNGPLVSGGTVSIFKMGAAGSRLVFVADKETENVSELYSVPIDGSAPPIKLSGPMVAGGDVVECQISRDGTRVVYRADQETDELYGLYGVPVDGSAPAVRLDHPFFNGDVQGGLVISSNG